MTNRREPRENRARTDALRARSLSVNSIFYSSYVAPSLDILIPCELPCVRKFPLPCPERDVNHHHAPARLHRGCPEAVLPFDPKRSHVVTRQACLGLLRVIPILVVWREDFNVSISITIAVNIYHGIYAPRVHHGRIALSSAPSSSRLGAAPASSTFDVDIERGRLPLARRRFKFQTRRARTRARKPRSRPRASLVSFFALLT